VTVGRQDILQERLPDVGVQTGVRDRARTADDALSTRLDRQLVSTDYARDPHPLNHRLREVDPVHWSDALKMWVPTRYADVKRILDDWEHFSSADVNAPRIRRLLRDVPEPARSRVLEFWEYGGLFQSDPPVYRGYRSVVVKALIARLRTVEPRIHEIVDGLIDEFAKAGRADLVRDVAYPLPATIIFELLGVEEDRRAEFRSWAEALVLAMADQSGESALRASNYLEAGYKWLDEVVSDRRHAPRDDLISVMVKEKATADMVGPDLFATIIFLLLAGHETTANLIATGVYELLMHPADLEDLLRDPTRIEGVVEETLRLESPIQTTARRVLGDMEFGGRKFHAGDVVVIMHGAANRDPARFPDPDTWLPGRDSSGHLAFGQGVHFCVGAPLARLEGPIAIETIVTRLAKLEIASQPTWRANTTFRGLEALEVTFDAGEPAN
jgi:cytochrome P450